LTETIPDAIALLVAIVLVAGAAHKIHILRTGSAEAAAVLDAAGLGARPHEARIVLRALIVIEAVLASLVMGANPVGVTCAGALLATYTVLLLRLPPEAECGCISERLSLGRSAQAGVWRNIALCGCTSFLAVYRGSDLTGWRQSLNGLALGVFVLGSAAGGILLTQANRRIPRNG
jgi:hypothetical protein